MTSLRGRQRLLVLLACSTVLLVSLGGWMLCSLVAFSQECRSRLGGLGDSLAAPVGTALAAGDEARVARSLEALKADPAIGRAAILDGAGRVLARYGPAGAEPGGWPLRTRRPMPWIELRPWVELPVRSAGVRLGSIVLEQDPRLVVDRIKATAATALGLLAACLGLSLLLAERIQRALTGPVVDMASAMAAVGTTRDYTRRLGPCGYDELDRLAECFNGMLSEVAARDETLQERQNSLENLANYDSLTRLPNRALFLQRLEQALPRAARCGEQVSVLFIDLDDFKLVNETHGHSTGDLLLREAALRLEASSRGVDTLARLGGDEFSILLLNVKDAENALKVARKHVDRLSRPFLIGGNRLFVSASIGVAVFPEHGETTEILVKSADTAMYRAKKLGKNHTELFTGTLHAEVAERLNLGNDLHRALENGEFVVHYQPRFDPERKLCTGVEALLRWNHPALGLIPPGKFVPLAEQTGLILPLGEWVIREACRQMGQWHDEGIWVPRMAVNISPLQVQRQDLVSILKDATGSVRLRTQDLELEVVESALMEHLDLSVQVLTELQQLGIRISIDDFGTGYSSLSLLRALPVDLVKIDRLFVANLPESEQDRQILTAILAMARSLHLDVVAEGIERGEQEQALLDLGCEEVQGFYYARPVPPRQLASWFLEHQRLVFQPGA